MIVGILKEIKTLESRVSMTPPGVEEMRGHGHTVLVEKGAGVGSGFYDQAYREAGARLVKTAAEIYGAADMVMHVKEPLKVEYPLLRREQIVFAYLHLAADEKQTRALIKSRCVAIAYETLQRPDRSLPLLVPMSEVAGRMSIQEGAKYLEGPSGGSGVLLGGVPGVEPATVLVIGAGTVGMHAAKMACGLGARVFMVDAYLPRLRYLSEVMPPNCCLLKSAPATIRRLIGRRIWWSARCWSRGPRRPRW
jgi:alanine dehydrogenase